ncbi:MAG TPA: DNA primase, partial [Bdellovibrionota bacterium]|nr:DNA primase [Bdellovibrionota bacterium]
IDVVGEHVVLRKSGSNHSGLCPFHSERTPSFSVSENKQLYHCYGCKKGGDLIGFTMDIHGLSFPEAVEELADRASVALPKDWDGGSSDDPETAARRSAAREKLATAQKLNRFVAAFYHQQLPRNPVALDYLKSRGVAGADLTRSFYTGFAPQAWESLAQHLVAKKAPLPVAQELGLIRPSTRKAQAPGGSGYFDLFRGRLMFPIIDLRGKVAGFGGRTLPGLSQEGEEAGPKYMNSAESFLFQKSRLAFGLFQAQKHIRERGEILLVEGYFDVIALHAAGFGHAVATCGTALTPDHLSIFRRLGEKVVVLFDGDRAGVEATERAMGVGLDQGIIIHGASMPAELDPDEILFDQTTGKTLEAGQARMTEILAGARPILDQMIDDALTRAQKSPEDRAQALKQIAGWLLRYKDPVGRDVRVHDVRSRLGAAASILDRLLGPAVAASSPSRPVSRPPQQRPNLRPNPRVASASQRRATRLSPAELALLKSLIRGGEAAQLFDESRGGLPPGRDISDLFEHDATRDWVRSVVTQVPELTTARFEPSMAADPGLDSYLRSILTEAWVEDGKGFDRSEFQAALDHQMMRCWARFSQQIKTELAAAEANKDAGLREKLLKDYLDVQRKMKEFTSFYDEA